jgi:Protein kinase domain
MSDDHGKPAPHITEQIDTPKAEAETERAASFRTTVPEFNATKDSESVTNAIRENETVTNPLGESASIRRSSQDNLTGLLGRFQYVRTLGHGAFGTVVQAWDPELQTHRAIKVPHHELIESGRVNADLYIAEARKLALLGRDAGIVSVVDVQRLPDGTPYVVSEYVPGESLNERINAGRMPWREAVELIAKAADAIGHAHSKGIVHRDLKPANILLNENGDPVVVDFGLALGDNEFSYRPSMCGTYSYMSPQQVRGEADRVDGRSDIFSLGVILYQLLAGRVPYKSRDVASLKREILEDEATPVRQYNRSVPNDLELVCQKALAKEPKDRFSTAADFAVALRKTLATAETAQAPAKSRTAFNGPLIAVAAAGLAALALLGVFMSRQSPTEQVAPVAASNDAAPELNARCETEVINPVGEGWIDRGPMTAKVLPLRVGDQLRFKVDLDQPGFVYVYWIDYAGNVTRKWPAGSDLSQQAAVKSVVSPQPTPTGEPQGWGLESRSGPEAVFIGVSARPLGAEELRDCESQIAEMPHGLAADKNLAEFEYPAIVEKMVLIDGVEERVRGPGQTPLQSAERLTVDHAQLRKLFDAYRGWAFQTQ